MAYAMPLNSSARACVPADLLQLISVDYRALKDSPTAMALKQQLMPDNIKQFEAALKNIGLDPDKDVDTLTFASFRAGKQGVKTVGVAAGPFNMKAVLKKMKLQKFVPKKYGNSLDLSHGRRLRDELPRRQHPAVRRLDVNPRRARYPRRAGSGSGYQRHHGRHDVECRLRAGLEHSRPAGHAEHDALCAWAMPPRSPTTKPSRSACWARATP